MRERENLRYLGPFRRDEFGEWGWWRWENMCVRAAGRGLQKPGGNERASVRARVTRLKKCVSICMCVARGVCFGLVHQAANKNKNNKTSI